MQQENPASTDKTRLRELAEDVLQEDVKAIESILHLHSQKAPFYPDVVEKIFDLDRRFWGVGIRHSVIVEDKYYFPYDASYSRVLLPLRYMLSHLGYTYYDDTGAKLVLQASDGYLEASAKTMFSTYRFRDMSLVTLTQMPAFRRRIEPPVKDHVANFAEMVSSPTYLHPDDVPNYKFADALYVYFMARFYGLHLQSYSGALRDMEIQVEEATRRQDFFYGTALPIVP